MNFWRFYLYLIITCSANYFSPAFLDLLFFWGGSFFYPLQVDRNYQLHFIPYALFFRTWGYKSNLFYTFTVTPFFAPPRGGKILSLFEDDIFCSDPLLSLISGGSSFLKCVIDSL